GICAVGTLTGAMAVAGRARELILPLLFLPMSIPVVVGGVGASAGLGGKYLAFLALYDAILALLAWASCEYVVAETECPYNEAFRASHLRCWRDRVTQGEPPR